MGVLTGIGGHIAKGTHPGGGNEVLIPCVRTWGITHSAALNEAVCSATRGGRMRIDGNKDWTGQFTGYGALPIIMPGDAFWFAGAITGSGASAIGAAGPVRCESVTISWDIEGGRPIEHTVTFGADGELTLGTITVPPDTSVPEGLSARGKKMELAPHPFTNFTAVDEVRTMTLTLTRANVAYVASATSGWTGRKMGNFDCTIEATLYAKDTDGWASFPQPNSIYAVRLYTKTLEIEGVDEYWLVKWAKFGDLGAMDVDIEGGAMVGGSMSAGFTGVTPVSGVPTVGEVLKPGGAPLWPV